MKRDLARGVSRSVLLLVMAAALVSARAFADDGLLAGAKAAPGGMPLVADGNAPVDLTADRLIHDEETQTITAIGHVELVQDGRILRADRVVYNMPADRAIALGNVVLNEPDGDVHFADQVEFTDRMKNGFVSGLRSMLADGSRFTAKEGTRTGGTRIEMREASYTPCEPCKAHPEKDPLWQLKADKMVYNQDEHRIVYNDATFEMFGVPLLWTPWFAHSDGSIKRKSGFLTPDVGWNSRLGGIYSQGYYWDLAPDHDVTMGVMAMTAENPLVYAETRNRWAHAKLDVKGSATSSGRTDSIAGQEVDQGDELRGHLFAEGLWDIDEKWRAGLNLQLTSDDQYLRQYDLGSDDVLENEVYAERFSGRNYASARVLAFQDVRVNENRVDQPDVLPEIIASFYGEPGQTLGGRWSLDLSALGLSRSGSGQDMDRIVLDAGWQRRTVADFGLVTTFNAAVRGDVYYVADRDIVPGATADSESMEFRGLPQIHVVSSYPLVKPLTESQIVVEPLAALTVAPNLHENNDIPNEDSQDAQIDAGNLFEPDRFPGMDKVEDGSRATYGLRSGVYGNEGSYASVFAGQSYRFDGGDTPFARGSGLDRQSSDVVGQVSAVYQGDYGLNYRFQLDSSTLASERHEVDAFAEWDRLRLTSRYLFANAIEGTGIDESREQILGGVTYQLTDTWSVRGSTLHDLGQDPGLRKASFGFDYVGQCMNFSSTLRRKLTRDSSGDSSTEIMFRIGFKNLGEFKTSGLTLDSSED